MRAVNIIIEPFQLLDLRRCDIHKKINEHSTAQVIGTIDSKLEDKYAEMQLEGIVCRIKAEDNNGKIFLVFQGIVKSAKIHYQNQVRTLILDLVSRTYLMDQEPCDRTFQNAAMSYHDMLRFCEKNYPDFDLIMTKGQDETLGDLIVQYRETDWAFAKRMASHFKTILLPASESELEGTRYYFGLPKREGTIKIKPINYTTHKAVGEYIHKIANHLDGFAERDAIYYETKDREVYFVGQKVIFKGRDLVVYEVKSSLDGQELIHKYILKEEDGFQVTQKYNEKQIGASLEGKILEVRQDQVKVHVLVDESQDKATAKWFTYSTVYSSPSGSGWYAMPEIGDAVRLYFPNEKEAEAYIISATHLEAEKKEARKNPDHKSLMTRHGKELKLTPGSVVFTNNKGMSVEILDEEGINIISDKAITIRADKSLAMVSLEEDIQVAAQEAITLGQGGARIDLQDKFIASGAGFFVQGSSDSVSAPAAGVAGDGTGTAETGGSASGNQSVTPNLMSSGDNNTELEITIKEKGLFKITESTWDATESKVIDTKSVTNVIALVKRSALDISDIPKIHFATVTSTPPSELKHKWQFLADSSIAAEGEGKGESILINTPHKAGKYALKITFSSANGEEKSLKVKVDGEDGINSVQKIEYTVYVTYDAPDNTYINEGVNTYWLNAFKNGSTSKLEFLKNLTELIHKPIGGSCHISATPRDNEDLGMQKNKIKVISKADKAFSNCKTLAGFHTELSAIFGIQLRIVAPEDGPHSWTCCDLDGIKYSFCSNLNSWGRGEMAAGIRYGKGYEPPNDLKFKYTLREVYMITYLDQNGKSINLGSDGKSINEDLNTPPEMANYNVYDFYPKDGYTILREKVSNVTIDNIMYSCRKWVDDNNYTYEAGENATGSKLGNKNITLSPVLERVSSTSM